jgi:hypothetical protein
MSTQIGTLLVLCGDDLPMTPCPGKHKILLWLTGRVNCMSGALLNVKMRRNGEGCLGMRQLWPFFFSQPITMRRLALHPQNLEQK